MIPHVTDHMTSPTAHVTVSRMPSHFGSPLAESENDILGDAAHVGVAGDADSCYGYFAVATHKPAETACQRTYYRLLVIRNASQGTQGASYAWGEVALPPVLEY